MQSHWKDALRAGSPRAVSELRAALRADAAIVRMGAFDELMQRYERRHGTRAASEDLRSPLQQLHLLLSSGLASLHLQAANSIEQLLDRLDAGDSLRKLDLRFDGGTPGFRERLGAAIRRGGPIPLARIASATHHERRYAEVLLAVQLDKPSAYRCPGALAELNARWTVPAMKEVLSAGACDAYMQRELRAATSQLEVDGAPPP